MAKFIILSLGLVAICEAGLIPNELAYSHFPHLKTVDHGHGATSYQNVDVENWGSVPIPKDLQVDDGHEHNYHHQQSPYLHHQENEYHHEIPSFELQHYENSHVNGEHAIVSTEAPYELNEHVEHLELESQHHYVPPSHYENYDHQIEYEYH